MTNTRPSSIAPAHCHPAVRRSSRIAWSFTANSEACRASATRLAVRASESAAVRSGHDREATRRASGSALRDFGCTFKIYNAALLRAFQFGPYHVFSNVDAISRLSRCAEVPITHYPRKYGRSGWTFRKLWQYNMDNLVKLSQRPFQVLAGFCFIGGILFALRILLAFFSAGGIMTEVTPGLILNTVFFFALITLSAIDLVGELVIRSFLTLQHLPAYVVRERRCRDTDSSDEHDTGST